MVAGDDGADLRRPARGLLPGPHAPADARDVFLRDFALAACDHLTIREAGEGAAPSERFDVVFGYGSAVDAPGRGLAARLGARFVPVAAPERLEARAARRPSGPPGPRRTIPRICLFGPESKIGRASCRERVSSPV